MRMKNDGHIKFYTQSEFGKLAGEAGMELENAFMTKIRFPRKLTEGYSILVDGTNKDILDTYSVEVSGDEIYITEQVQNIFYRKIRSI